MSNEAENNKESPQVNSPEKGSKNKVESKQGLESFVPEGFKSEPVKYFEEKGQNIKSGEIKYHEDGTVREDPSAVKDFPNWVNSVGQQIEVVGKRVNEDKAQVGETGDPFYEYKVMEMVNEVGLPAPRPIAKAEQGDQHLFVMEKAPGIRWNERQKVLQAGGMSKDDIEKWEETAREKMAILAETFEEYGIKRGWKEQDMVFDVDPVNKGIRKITVTDWERTKIDTETFNKKRVEMTQEGLEVKDILLTPEERVQKLDEEIKAREMEITDLSQRAEKTTQALVAVREDLDMGPAIEVPPSIKELNEDVEKLKEKKEKIEEKKEKIKEEKKKLKAEIMKLLQEKISEAFQKFSQLEQKDLDSVMAKGILKNGEQLELSKNIKVLVEIAKGLGQAFKENITEPEEILKRFPVINQAKSALRQEAKKRLGI